MKAKTLILILLLIPVLVNAQFEFRPILDPAALCNEETVLRPKYHILNPLYQEKEEPHSQYQIFYIVEKMPVPKISADDIEDMLGNVIHFNNQEKTYKTTMHFQCVVNCRGEAGDYQIIYCPDEMVDIGDQVLKVFRERFNNWSPGLQREKSVDVLVRIRLMVHEGKFKVKAPGW
jgi:hypothetical protein